VRALSGGEGSLIDTGGVSMGLLKSSHYKRDEYSFKIQVIAWCQPFLPIL